MSQNPFLAVLKNHNFLKIWGSQILSQITINLVNFLIILRIFNATHSSVAVSFVWVFYAMPALLLGPFSGTIVDLVSKKRVLRVTTFLEGLAILSYVLVKQRLWPIYTIIFFYSLINQLYIPAEGSTLPSIVEKKLLPTANSFFIFTVYGSLLLGFALAGPLVRLIGHEWPFVICGLLLFLASGLVSQLPSETKKEKKIIDFEEFWNLAKEGYVFLNQNRNVLFPLLVLVGIQVVAGVVTVLAPSYAYEILGIDLRDAGPFLVIPLALGAVSGIYIINRFLIFRLRKKYLVAFSFFLSGISFLGLSCIIPLLTTGKLFLAGLLVFSLGLSMVASLVPAQTLIQEQTPSEFRGRIFGVLGFTVTLCAVLPVLSTAAIADIMGTNLVLALIGLAILFSGIYVIKEGKNGI